MQQEIGKTKPIQTSWQNLRLSNHRIAGIHTHRRNTVMPVTLRLKVNVQNGETLSQEDCTVDDSP
jgi:hypothetical protein